MGYGTVGLTDLERGEEKGSDSSIVERPIVLRPMGDTVNKILMDLAINHCEGITDDQIVWCYLINVWGRSESSPGLFVHSLVYIVMISRQTYDVYCKRVDKLLDKQHKVGLTPEEDEELLKLVDKMTEFEDESYPGNDLYGGV